MGESFGEYLLRLRGKRTRKEVAEAARISAEYLRQIEHQGKIPKEDKLIGLAEALGLDTKEVLTRALHERNQEAAETILSVKPRFPRMRATLMSRLGGLGVEVVASDMEWISLSPHERSAVFIWGCVFYMDRDGLDEKASREKTKERIKESSFVEGALAEYVERYLVSWQVDPETGIQSHYTESPGIREILGAVTGYLGHPRWGHNQEADVEFRAFSELLKEPEFVSLYRNLKKYTALNKQDRADIRAWWELVNRMVEEKLSK